MPEPLPQVLRYECGHYADAETGHTLNPMDIDIRIWVKDILAPCRACGPQKAERLKKRGDPYHELPE